MQNQEGISKLIGIIIIAAIAIIAVGGVLAYQHWRQPKPVACTEEAKICPDGTAVGRTGPNCEFAPCKNEQAGKCAVTGCNGELCADSESEKLFTACQWKAMFSCFKKAQCERQSDGKCGWTMTQELNSCLEANK